MKSAFFALFSLSLVLFLFPTRLHAEAAAQSPVEQSTFVIKGNTYNQIPAGENGFTSEPYEITVSLDKRAVIIIKGTNMQIFHILSFYPNGREGISIKLDRAQKDRVDVYSSLVPGISRNSITAYVNSEAIAKYYRINIVDQYMTFNEEMVSIEVDYWIDDDYDVYFDHVEELQYTGLTQYPYKSIESAIRKARSDSAAQKPTSSKSAGGSSIEAFLSHYALGDGRWPESADATKTVDVASLATFDWRSRLREVLGTGSHTATGVGMPAGTTTKDMAKGGTLANNPNKAIALYRKADGTIHFGESINGSFEGIGVIIPPVGSTVENWHTCKIFCGSFQNNKPSVGRAYDSDGELMFFGHYRPTDEDVKKEFTLIKYPSGDEKNRDFYLGEKIDGKRHGYGIMVWKDNSIWIGTWRNDLQDNLGIYIYSDGQFTTGYWHEGKFSREE